jgi:hypothetical protein
MFKLATIEINRMPVVALALGETLFVDARGWQSTNL